MKIVLNKQKLGREPGIDISILDTGVIDIQRGPIHFRFLTYGKAPVGFLGTVGPLGPHWRASYLMPLWAGAYGFILGPYGTI